MTNSINSDFYDLNEALKVENLTTNDFKEICKRLGRDPNRTELGMFGVMWSEHCCYRNSKPLLANFPTKGRYILVGPGESAIGGPEDFILAGALDQVDLLRVVGVYGKGFYRTGKEIGPGLSLVDRAKEAMSCANVHGVGVVGGNEDVEERRCGTGVA